MAFRRGCGTNNALPINPIIFTLLFFFLTTYTQAGYAKNGALFPSSLHHLHISAAGGPSWYTTANTHTVISSFESDKNNVTHASVHSSWSVGLNYSLFTEFLKQNKYLNEVLFGLNAYQTSTSLYGMTWQYELPEFNNYSFKAPITSKRLMLDLRPSFFTWRTATSYLILGAGVTFNDVSYSETATSDINSNTALYLSAKTLTQAAFDLGLGFKMALTQNLSFSMEYLYAFLGHGYSMSYSNGVALITPPRFSLRNQSLLFGLNIQF